MSRARRIRNASAVVAAIIAATPASAQDLPGDASFCDSKNPQYGAFCGVFDAYCGRFLDDPANFDLTRLKQVPAFVPAYISRGNQLSADLLGYLDLPGGRMSVVYYDNAPACEILSYHVPYATLLDAYRAWRDGPGAGFAATTDFEPVSRPGLAHAYAAVFLAGERSDGRVTEITFNWNLNVEGLTRFKVTYQSPREHTENMLAARDTGTRTE